MVIEAQDPTPAAAPGVALAVDLDGTLVRTDTLHESLLKLIRTRPLDLLRLPAWLAAGKARFKHEVAARAPLDAALLPYDDGVVARLRAARDAGRRTALATAADRAVAEAVADHLGLFDDVLASEPGRNLSGEAKRDALVARYGERGYDYVADAPADTAAWSAARSAIVVNGVPTLIALLKDDHGNVEVASRRGGQLRALIEAARPYQWVKNLLVFVPILAAQRLDGEHLMSAALAFLFFGLAASSVYLVNDLMDLEADRRHPRKRQRPFAAGRLPPLYGMIAAAVLIVLALAGAFLTAPLFGVALLAYLAVTSAYSAWLKRFPLIDVIVLAGLYTLRIIAGGVATETPLTLWLLAFSMFLFTSLAFAKRYAEVADVFERGEREVDGRGYRAGDQSLLMALGSAAGLASIVTLALFVNSPSHPDLYNTPELLWGVCPVLLYWVARIWLAAQRGILTDDPIVFAFGDPASRAALAVALIPVAAAIWL